MRIAPAVRLFEGPFLDGWTDQTVYSGTSHSGALEEVPINGVQCVHASQCCGDARRAAAFTDNWHLIRGMRSRSAPWTQRHFLRHGCTLRLSSRRSPPTRRYLGRECSRRPVANRSLAAARWITQSAAWKETSRSHASTRRRPQRQPSSTFRTCARTVGNRLRLGETDADINRRRGDTVRIRLMPGASESNVRSPPTGTNRRIREKLSARLHSTGRSAPRLRSLGQVADHTP